MSIESPPFVEIPQEDVDLIEYAGAGQFGTVYRGRWKNMEVAVKKTLCFDNEAQLLSSLRHQNIITFLGACTKAPHSFLVTEYAEYGNLYDYLENAELQYDRVLIWCLDIGLGMRYLHEMGVIHRDLKSLNVLVCAKDEDELILKICDFGCSRAIGRESSTLAAVGTMAWMAPEVVRGEQNDESADVWSFGVIMWELLTLEVPYAGLQPYQVLALVANEGMHPHLPASCPTSYANLYNSCVAQHSEDRPTFDNIVQSIDIMTRDEIFKLNLTEFLENKEDWQEEIDRISHTLKQLEKDRREIYLRVAELESREADLRRRELALEQQLQAHHMSLGQTYSSTPLATPESPQPVAAWDVQQVAAWIEVLPKEFHKYGPIFVENDIDGNILTQLDEDSLKNALGIKSLGHRKKLLNMISQLGLSSEFPPLLSPSKPVASPSLQLPPFIDAEITFMYTVDNQIDAWKMEIKEDENGFIADVLFLVIHSDNVENDKVSLHAPPFQYSRKFQDTRNCSLFVSAVFKPELFRRKTVKRVYEIASGLGMSKKDTVTVKLKPKQRFKTERPDWLKNHSEQQLEEPTTPTEPPSKVAGFPVTRRPHSGKKSKHSRFSRQVSVSSYASSSSSTSSLQSSSSPWTTTQRPQFPLPSTPTGESQWPSLSTGRSRSKSNEQKKLYSDCASTP